jgi:hypothetical protein
MATTNTDQIAALSDEAQMLHELGIKAPPKSMLDVHKNPLLISILDGVDTLRTMASTGEIPTEYLQAAKGLLLMKTDKVKKLGWRCIGAMFVEPAY